MTNPSIADRLKSLGVQNADEAVANLNSEGRYINLKDGPFQVVGTVVGSTWTRQNPFGSVDHGLTVKTEDETVKLSLSATAWVSALEDQEPNNGDVVVIVYKGKAESKQGKKYHDLALKVVQRAAGNKELGTPPF